MFATPRSMTSITLFGYMGSQTTMGSVDRSLIICYRTFEQMLISKGKRSHFEMKSSIFQISRACSSEKIPFKDTNTAQNCCIKKIIVQRYVFEHEVLLNATKDAVISFKN